MKILLAEDENDLREVVTEFLKYHGFLVTAVGNGSEAVEKAKCFGTFHWEINTGEVTIRDHAEKEKSKNIVFVTFNRFSYISYKVDSIESFYSTFKKAYDAVADVLGNMTIQRIGCRIIGTYGSS